MLLKEFLGVIYHKTNLRIIGGGNDGLSVLFRGVRDDVPEGLKDMEIQFIDVDLKVDVEDMYTATAGIRIFLK